VYGDKQAVEWPLIEHEPLIVHTAKKPEPEIPAKVECPDFAKLLPEEIQKYTRHGVYDSEDQTHLSFLQGSGHGGSHPHLVHQFVKMLKTSDDAYPNAVQSANVTCVGILAHESALKGGDIIPLPEFTLM
ncbi:MAG: gfo/Idh/MocA family oxidoreductase, partial [Lentisphaerales bacterium]|nr:gfo/Idh/MocA family oxidoreductase [Lentisphaerales bacterium]